MKKQNPSITVPLIFQVPVVLPIEGDQHGLFFVHPKKPKKLFLVLKGGQEEMIQSAYMFFFKLNAL